MTDIEKEREAFESWAGSAGFLMDVFRPSSHYESDATESAWEGWLARARSERVVSVDALENIFTRIEWPPQESQWVILREDFDSLISKAGVGDE